MEKTKHDHLKALATHANNVLIRLQDLRHNTNIQTIKLLSQAEDMLKKANK